MRRKECVRVWLGVIFRPLGRKLGSRTAVGGPAGAPRQSAWIGSPIAPSSERDEHRACRMRWQGGAPVGAKHRACPEVRTGPARGPAGPTGMLGAVGVARGNKFCAIFKYLSGSKQTTSVSIRQVRTVVTDETHLVGALVLGRSPESPETGTD